MVPTPGGWAILDGVNSRIVRLDPQGKTQAVIDLPKGLYKDLAVGTDGRLWTIETEKRTALAVTGSEAAELFALPAGEGQPRWVDGLTVAGSSLVVGDFQTESLYWFSFAGKLQGAASWPTALSLVADAAGQVCCLALGEDDRYERLVRLTPTGVATETRIEGEALEGARLLGFLPDGRPVGVGILKTEPLTRQLFTITGAGVATPVSTIPTPGGLLFATRPGLVASTTVWLNLSQLKDPILRFGTFEIAP